MRFRAVDNLYHLEFMMKVITQYFLNNIYLVYKNTFLCGPTKTIYIATNIWNFELVMRVAWQLQARWAKYEGLAAGVHERLWDRLLSYITCFIKWLVVKTIQMIFNRHFDISHFLTAILPVLLPGRPITWEELILKYKKLVLINSTNEMKLFTEHTCIWSVISICLKNIWCLKSQI